MLLSGVLPAGPARFASRSGLLCAQLWRRSGCLAKRVGRAPCPPTSCPLQGLPGYVPFGGGSLLGFSMPRAEVPIIVATPRGSSLSGRREAKTRAQAEAAACAAAQARGLRSRALPGAAQPFPAPLPRPPGAATRQAPRGSAWPSCLPLDSAVWEPGICTVTSAQGTPMERVRTTHRSPCPPWVERTGLGSRGSPLKPCPQTSSSWCHLGACYQLESQAPRNYRARLCILIGSPGHAVYQEVRGARIQLQWEENEKAKGVPTRRTRGHIALGTAGAAGGSECELSAPGGVLHPPHVGWGVSPADSAAKGQRKAWSPRGALARAETEACGCGVGESHQRHKKENAGWPRTRHRTRCPLEAPDAVRPVCVAEPRPQGPCLSWGGRISACCRQGEPRRDALAPSTSSAWWT